MKKILIVAENFYPAFKAGGPIQSLTNLVLALEYEYVFYVVTSAYDMRSKQVMENIQVNKWNEITLPGSKATLLAWYTDQKKAGHKPFQELLKATEPDYIYLNGIFSFRYFLIPLIAAKKYKHKLKTAICPRGMLQKGALAGKSFKKKIYLKSLKVSGLLNKIKWHATNSDEKNDILTQFPASSSIMVAMNIPKKPLQEITIQSKGPGILRVVYLSLITEKKNLLFLLKIMNSTENISLDIYGPVKDVAYWNECKKLINQMPGKVKYCGDVLPIDVQKVLPQYHALALLTKGENFGHALYESLSVGRPIVTSNYTPWNNLKTLNAGRNVDIKNIRECANAFEELYQMPENDYGRMCEGAFNVASNYYNALEIKESYGQLFS